MCAAIQQERQCWWVVGDATSLHEVLVRVASSVIVWSLQSSALVSRSQPANASESVTPGFFRGDSYSCLFLWCQAGRQRVSFHHCTEPGQIKSVPTSIQILEIAFITMGKSRGAIYARLATGRRQGLEAPVG